MGKEIRGTKYSLTEKLDIVDVAKLVRKDLKEAFPTYKFNVQIQRYSMGQSLHIQIKNTGLEYKEKIGQDAIHALEMAVRDIAYQYDKPETESRNPKFYCNDVRVRS